MAIHANSEDGLNRLEAAPPVPVVIIATFLPWPKNL